MGKFFSLFCGIFELFLRPGGNKVKMCIRDRVCIEPGADMTFDIKSSVRLVNAKEYSLNSFECLRGFISGLYAGNYDISHVFVDNLAKIAASSDLAEADKFLHWLDRFSEENCVKFTVTLSLDESMATEDMRSYL